MTIHVLYLMKRMHFKATIDQQYTPCLEKRRHYIFASNFAKC